MPTLNSESFAITLDAERDASSKPRLRVEISGKAAPKESVQIRVPSAWAAQGAQATTSSVPKDTHLIKWGIDQRMDELTSPPVWVYELSRPAKTSHAAAHGLAGPTFPWTLTFTVALGSGGAAAIEGVGVRIDGTDMPAPALPLQAAAPTSLVELSVLGEAKEGYEYGAAVTLRCRLRGVRSATLWSAQGAMVSAVVTPAATTTGGASATPNLDGSLVERDFVVRALQHTAYVLTATVDQGGVSRDIREWVTIDVKRSPQTGRLMVWPPAVLPGGPVACFWWAVEVTEFTFRVHDAAGLDRVTVGARGKKKGVTESILDRSFTLHWGPPKGESWTIGADYAPATKDSKRLEHSVRAISPRVISSVKRPDVVARAAAAGRFFGIDRGGRKPAAERLRRWFAVGTDSGLELYVEWEKSGPQRFHCIDAESRQFIGLAAADTVREDEQNRGTFRLDPTRHSLVAIRRERRGDERPDVWEYDLEPNEVTDQIPCRLVGRRRFTLGGRHEDGFRVSRIRVLVLDERVYIVGHGAAGSYTRLGSEPGWIEEPLLQNVATPDWELVALPARKHQRADAPPAGSLFALHKPSGAFVRFDRRTELDAAAGSLEPPLALRKANDRTAKLDMLQRAQLGEMRYIEDGRFIIDERFVPPDPAGALVTLTDLQKMAQEERVGLRALTRKPITAIDGRSVLLAVDGAILARSVVADPDGERKRLNEPAPASQDRAYDPQLDVWVRCGHSFPDVPADGAVLAATENALYCRAADGTVSSIADKGLLLPALGFLGTEVSPLRRTAFTSGIFSAWPPAERSELRVGDTLRRDDVLVSPNGEHRMIVGPDNDLVWLTQGAEVGRSRTQLDGVWTLERDGDLVRWGVDHIERKLSDHALTLDSPLRYGRGAALSDVRLLVTNDGNLVCQGHDGRRDVVLWHVQELATDRDCHCHLCRKFLRSKGWWLRELQMRRPTTKLRPALLTNPLTLVWVGEDGFLHFNRDTWQQDTQQHAGDGMIGVTHGGRNYLVFACPPRGNGVGRESCALDPYVYVVRPDPDLKWLNGPDCQTVGSAPAFAINDGVAIVTAEFQWTGQPGPQWGITGHVLVDDGNDMLRCNKSLPNSYFSHSLPDLQLQTEARPLQITCALVGGRLIYARPVAENRFHFHHMPIEREDAWGPTVIKVANTSVPGPAFMQSDTTLALAVPPGDSGTIFAAWRDAATGEVRYSSCDPKSLDRWSDPRRIQADLRDPGGATMRSTTAPALAIDGTTIYIAGVDPADDTIWIYKLPR